MWNEAERALDGVGDASLGEWRETGDVAVHLRRRLTPIEWGDKPWGMDYRATFEGKKRLDRIVRYLPEHLHAQIMSELTDAPTPARPPKG
jgi:hypothetical protein